MLQLPNGRRLRMAIWCAVSDETQLDGVSMEEQLRCGLEFAAHWNAEVVVIFNWDGYSRYESDLIDALDDFAKQGRFDYHNLRELWKKKALDLLWCYHDSRLARNEVLYAWVVVNVIRSGSLIWRHIGGLMDARSKTFQVALGIIAATTSVEHLIEGRKAAMDRRRRQGLSTSSRILETHIRIRDPISGDELGRTVDEARRPLWDAIYELATIGTNWREFEERLHADYGFGYPDGRQLSHGRIYQIVMNPAAWGHNVQFFRGEGQDYGLWRVESGHEVPERTKIEYDRFAPVWAGEQGEAIKSRLRERKLARGRFRPSDPFRYTGLFVCDECGYLLGKVTSHGRGIGLRCQTRYYQGATRPECTQTANLPLEKADAFIDLMLRRMLAKDDPYLFLKGDRQATMEKQRQQLEAKLFKAQQTTANLVLQRAGMGPNVQEIMTQQLNALETEIGQYKLQLTRLTSQQIPSGALLAADNAFHQIRDICRDGGTVRFREQPDLFIHQVLSDLMINRRVSVRDGKVKHIVDAPSFGKQRRPKR